MQIIEASFSCYAKVHLAVPGAYAANSKPMTSADRIFSFSLTLKTLGPAGAKGHLTLIFKLNSQEGWIADRSLLELAAQASTKSLGKRYAAAHCTPFAAQCVGMLTSSCMCAGLLRVQL
jgi:hypothetical protein